jgi:uncharacterized protein (TIGR02118 family)
MYTPTLFLCWRDGQREASAADLAYIGEVVSGVAGIERARAYTPTLAPDHPYASEGRGPALTLELWFAHPGALEAAAAARGPLARLVEHGALPSLAGVEIDTQAFGGRDFPTPDPKFRLGPGERACTFVIEYPGTAADPLAWLDHYDAHHPPIMVRFPGIRAVATFRPAPEIAVGLPVKRAAAMQRNKVAFDSVEALAAALASPVMAEMRVDSAKFPPVDRRPTHFPCATSEFV